MLFFIEAHASPTVGFKSTKKTIKKSKNSKKKEPEKLTPHYISGLSGCATTTSDVTPTLVTSLVTLVTSLVTLVTSHTSYTSDVTPTLVTSHLH